MFREVDDDGYIDERVAEEYDSYEDREEFGAEDIEATADFLVRYAGKGPALEFGIGTGRIGLPLSRRGVPTHGIDLSRPMVSKLKTKPGGDDVPVTIGDFATTKVEGTFQLVYLVCNTIMNLTTSEAQVACFRNAARISATRRKCRYTKHSQDGLTDDVGKGRGAHRWAPLRRCRTIKRSRARPRRRRGRRTGSSGARPDPPGARAPTSRPPALPRRPARGSATS
jgi:hypothetical protein